MSAISSNKELFDAAAPPYKEALDRAGYNHKLEFVENIADNVDRRKRKRNAHSSTLHSILMLKQKLGRNF